MCGVREPSPMCGVREPSSMCGVRPTSGLHRTQQQPHTDCREGGAAGDAAARDPGPRAERTGGVRGAGAAALCAEARGDHGGGGAVGARGRGVPQGRGAARAGGGLREALRGGGGPGQGGARGAA
eukprot:1297777-Rhodomonas_salina.1